MREWASWGIVVLFPITKEEILEIPGMVEGRDLPIYQGTLGSFALEYKRPFKVYNSGKYIEVGVG